MNVSLILVVSFATDRNITAKTPRIIPIFMIGKNTIFKIYIIMYLTIDKFSYKRLNIYGTIK